MGPLRAPPWEYYNDLATALQNAAMKLMPEDKPVASRIGSGILNTVSQAVSHMKLKPMNRLHFQKQSM